MRSLFICCADARLLAVLISILCYYFTKKFIYATMPTTGEVWQISTTNLNVVKKIKVGNKPFKIAILGGESN